MKMSGDGQLLRIFIGEDDRWGGKPLHEAIITRAREMGIAGCTVLRGLKGYGANSRIHTTKVLRLSEDLPLIIEIVDRKEQIEALLPELDNMVDEGLITLENVKIIAYRHSRKAEEEQQSIDLE